MCKKIPDAGKYGLASGADGGHSSKNKKKKSEVYYTPLLLYTIMRENAIGNILSHSIYSCCCCR